MKIFFKKQKFTMTTVQVIVVSILFISFVLPTSPKKPDDFKLVTKGIVEYFHTGNPPGYFVKALKNYHLTHMFRDGMENRFDKGAICFLCNLVVDLILDARKFGLQRDSFAKILKFLCTNLDIENERVCTGVIELNIDVFLYAVDKHPNFSSHRICGTLLQIFECSTGHDFDWTINIASGNSAIRPTPNDTDVKTFNILQLSDIHYDPLYKPYGNAHCGEPICCQTDQGEPTSNETTCGYWTDYREADVPWHFIEETIRQVNTQEFDYVYYTGDIVAHRVWETSIENNTKSISQLHSFFKESFDVPVYPVFGNHEPHPLNLWPSENIVHEKFSVRWLFELAAEEWSKLVGEDVSETVLKGGYYTVSPKPGFRIVAINNNFCYTFNWWLLFDDVDPYGQLQWLADTLKKAEDANESVHILSHVPTGSLGSVKVWGREYARIIERFSNIITGQFNGHTHRDEFHVFYNSSNVTEPVGVIFNGASVTPYTLSNPSYKLYQVEDSMFTLLDYEEWTFNLTLANMQPSTELPGWYKLYSFTEAFGVENLSPSEVDKVLYKMASNHSLLDDYFIFKFRNGDLGIKSGCNDVCKKNNLCEIVITIHGEDTQCKYFLNLYNQ